MSASRPGQPGQRGQLGQPSLGGVGGEGGQGGQGEQGERGGQGERGPVGAQGQAGQAGQRGESGPGFNLLPKLQLFAYIAVLAAVAFGFWQLEQTSERIRAGQLEACKAVSEPVRLTLIASIEEDIERSERLSPDLFPDIPRKQFDELVQEQNMQRQGQVDRLEEVPSCAERFAPP